MKKFKAHFLHVLSLGFGLSTATLVASEQPTIISLRIEGGEVKVVARIPTGLKKALLESRDRVAGSSWIPRQITRLDGTAQREVAFQVPMTEQLEFIRIRADESEPLPANYYAGTNQFNGEIAAGPINGVPPSRSPGDILTAGPGDRAEESKSVVESDIWKMRKLIKKRMENKVVNFVGLNKVVLGIKWMNGMVKCRFSDGWTEI